jgi:hypothetical protein
MKRLIMFSMIVSLMVSSGFVYAQETEKEVNTGQDFTKPLTRFDVREKYQWLADDKDALLTTFRVDKPIMFKNGWGLGTRFDLPVMTTDVASLDNPRGDTEFGLSDFLAQGIMIAPQGKKSWTWAYGMQAILPTASQDAMGTGRYQIAPFVGAKADIAALGKGSFGYLLLREHIDAGGSDTRNKVNYLVINPGLNIAFPTYTFITMAPEIRVNWENDNRWFIPFDITIGQMLSRKLVVSLTYKTPVVDHKYPVYEHEIEGRVGFFF